MTGSTRLRSFSPETSDALSVKDKIMAEFSEERLTASVEHIKGLLSPFKIWHIVDLVQEAKSIVDSYTALEGSERRALMIRIGERRQSRSS